MEEAEYAAEHKLRQLLSVSVGDLGGGGGGELGKGP